MARKLIRPLVERLKPYVPGEQPKIPGLIKLNTNENPYPPSPTVLKTIKAAVDGRLRLYPNPNCDPLRARLAELHGCTPEHIMVGNGSDEILALAARAFIEPLAEAGQTPVSANKMQYLSPCYSLYPVLADIHGAVKNEVPLNPDFSLPKTSELRRNKQWDFGAALTFVTTPNAPTGRAYTTSELDALCRAQKGVVMLDEAYVDFAEENAMSLALKYPHVLVARTYSKAYCLCFQRVGYTVGHPRLIEAILKIKDSYNVNGLGQVAALATLDDLSYYRANFQKVIQSRQKLSAELTRLGFLVHPSQSNFIFTRPPGKPAKQWLEALREEKILVRWFSHPEVSDYLRISIGSENEVAALIRTAGKIAAQWS